MAEKILFETHSPLSGKIKVIDIDDVRELLVNDTLQSIWSENRNHLKDSYWERLTTIPFKIDNENLSIVMCGLGGGTCAKLFSEKYPTSQITALEFDPYIIAVAEDFFNLKDYKNITTIKTDALQWIEEQSKSQKHFDVLCLDTFIGEDFSLTLSDNLLKQIKQILSPHGLLITNRIYIPEFRKKTDDFLHHISSSFLETKTNIISGYTGTDNIIIYTKTPLL